MGSWNNLYMFFMGMASTLTIVFIMLSIYGLAVLEVAVGVKAAVVLSLLIMASMCGALFFIMHMRNEELKDEY